MAAGWFTVLKAVPWSDVISAAPQVAGGARKLWDAVARKAPGSPKAEAAYVEPQEQPGELGAVMHRLDKSEAQLVDLHGQMLTASEIIASLADQNGQLIARLDAMRSRMMWLGILAGGAAVLAVAAVAIVLTPA